MNLLTNMKSVKEAIEQIVSEQICTTPYYKKCSILFCDIMNEVEYCNFTENHQQFYCDESFNANCAKRNKITIKIMVVKDSCYFNNYENIKNEKVDLCDGEMIILPNMRVFVQNNNCVFIVAREFFVVRELYSILPYVYYKMRFFDAQPIILHACAVNIIDNNAYVFLGKSGAGKTTTAKLAHQSGLKILSDELVCITEKNGFSVNGTSISSSNCNVKLCNTKSNLSAFCIIEKNEIFQLYQHTNQNYNNILSNAVENSIFTNDILLTLFKLCHTIRFVHMRFYKDYIDWSAIKRDMRIFNEH